MVCSSEKDFYIMAHELEMIGDQASMAYAGDLPWHGLGVRVPSDLSPIQMLDAANLNWSVEKIPAYAEVAGKQVAVGKSALVRSSDNAILDVVSDDWNPMQNEAAFEFFNDFVGAGDMEMHTAGSLKGGKLVWGLAKVNDSFELFGGRDQVDSYLLFTNPHMYGQSIDVRMTPIRVVCNNTLSLSLNTMSKQMVKVSHRREFNADEVKETLGVAKEKLQSYKEMAEYLSKKRFNDENIVDYFKRVFPVITEKQESTKVLSKNAEIALEDILYTQPGAEFGEGTWWQAFNAVTYMTDHVMGRNADNRLQSAWFGQNKALKTKALDLALEMAEAA
jgi:phage/plasmid-like protein (TIGR03299 family)